MAITSPYPDVEIPDLSVFDYVLGSLSPDEVRAVAVVDGDTALTYGELVNQVRRVAGALAARGVRPGDVVALHAPNSAAFVALFHGILRAGATVTTVNSLYTAQDIGRQLADSGASFVVTVSVLREAMLTAARAAGMTDDQIVVADGVEGFTSFADLLAEARDAPQVTIDPATHLAVLPYSSGTTGLAKGVMLTHRNLVANVAQSRRLSAWTRTTWSRPCCRSSTSTA